MNDCLLGAVVNVKISLAEDGLDLLAGSNSLPIFRLFGSFFTHIIQNADCGIRLTNSCCGNVIKVKSTKFIASFSEEQYQLGILHVANGVAHEYQVELLVVLPRKIDEAGPLNGSVLPQFQFFNLIINFVSCNIALVKHVNPPVSISPEFKESTIATACV